MEVTYLTWNTSKPKLTKTRAQQIQTEKQGTADQTGKGADTWEQMQAGRITSSRITGSTGETLRHWQILKKLKTLPIPETCWLMGDTHWWIPEQHPSCPWTIVPPAGDPVLNNFWDATVLCHPLGLGATRSNFGPYWFNTHYLAFWRVSLLSPR